MTFMLQSPAFSGSGPIPKRYAQEGQNLSPALQWSDAPAQTRSFALMVEDPDAPSGTFRHWGVYDIDGSMDGLPEGVSAGDFPQALNDAGRARYDGPKPPRGSGIHHYHFRLAALDVANLDIGGRASVADVWKAAEPHVLAEAELIGTYEAD